MTWTAAASRAVFCPSPDPACRPNAIPPPRPARRAESNDDLAGQIAKHPDRYSGFAHLAMQDPKGAADELERCSTRSEILRRHDQRPHPRPISRPSRRSAPFWERADALGAVLYIHPADPVEPLKVLEGFPVLARPMWGWGVETGSHALRLVVGGHFERYPNVKLMLGHLGETLPFMLWRLDSRAQFQGLKLPKKPSEYIRRNVYVTTSGMCDGPPLRCSLDALGRDHVMFAADYPFEDAG